MRKCTENEATDIVTVYYDKHLIVIDVLTTGCYTDKEDDEIEELAQDKFAKLVTDCGEYLMQTLDIGYITFYII